MPDLSAVPPEAYEAAGLAMVGPSIDEEQRGDEEGYFEWHECEDQPNCSVKQAQPCSCAGMPWPSPTVRAAVDAVWSLGVAEGRRQAAEALAELQAKFDRHMWGHDWRPDAKGGARCRHCGFGKEGEPASHQMSCRLYEGPLRHEWLGHLSRANPTFGGDDYYCICGGWFRRGGMAGHGDGTATAVPVCPNADQTWRGAARIAEGNTDE